MHVNSGMELYNEQTHKFCIEHCFTRQLPNIAKVRTSKVVSDEFNVV